MVEYAHPGALVTTQWVADHGNDANVRLVEVDMDTAAYQRGHIAGAVGWNWQSQLQQTVRRDVISKAEVEQLLGHSGIDNNTTIVLYGDNNNWFAAWAFWQLRYYGHRDVKLMNGGRAKWVSENRPLTTEVPRHRARTYRASEPNQNIRAYWDPVLAAVNTHTIGFATSEAVRVEDDQIVADPAKMIPGLGYRVVFKRRNWWVENVDGDTVRYYRGSKV